jgi:hypothetical protein
MGISVSSVVVNQANITSIMYGITVHVKQNGGGIRARGTNVDGFLPFVKYAKDSIR